MSKKEVTWVGGHCILVKRLNLAWTLGNKLNKQPPNLLGFMVGVDS